MTKTRLLQLAKYGGFISVGLELLTFLLFYVKAPDGFEGDNPISFFAAHEQTKLIFAIGFSLAAISFLAFIWFHLRKVYKTPVLLFTLSMLSFIAVAAIPYNPPDPFSDSLHVYLAQLFHVTFVIGIYLMGRRNEDRKLKHISYAIVALNVLLTIPFLIARGGSQFLLILEIMLGFSNQIWALSVSYYSLTKKPLTQTVGRQ